MSSRAAISAGQTAKISKAPALELPSSHRAKPPDKGGLPCYTGPKQPKLVVVGEPFESEDQPFYGPAGHFFKELMLEAGIKPDKSGFCYAGGELVELMMELRPVWVVLSGELALQAIRPDLQLRGAHGRPFSLIPMGERGPRDARIGGSVCFPVFHHVAVKRRKELQPLVLQELLLLRRIATGTEGWITHTLDSCVKCRKEFFGIDDQGVVYCESHWESRLVTDGGQLLALAFNLDCDQGHPGGDELEEREDPYA